MNLNEFLLSQNPPSSDDVLGGRDLTKIFWKFKGLLKERERNEAFWESTNENLKIAYDKLDEQERKLDKAYSLNRKYLNNIKEGLLLIDNKYSIQNQYSTFLQELFVDEHIEGKNFIDFIYPDAEKFEKERKELGDFLNILFSNVVADMDMIMEVNPLKDKNLVIEKTDKKAKEIVVDASFTRIFEKEAVENVMIIFEDKTDFLKMQKKIDKAKSRYEAEIQSISAILKAGPQSFTDFLVESVEVLKDLKNNIDSLNDKYMINYLFRKVHSLKGNAKYLELNYISLTANKIEDIFSEIKEGKTELSSEKKEQIINIMKQLNKEFDNLNELINKFNSFSKITKEYEGNDEKISLDGFLHSLSEMTINISNDLNKSVKLIINNKLQDFPYLRQIKNSIIHIVRNSIDHGIEDRYERLSKDKKDTGYIKIRFDRDENDYVIDIIDDGAGINFDRIKQKAIEKKLITENDGNINNHKLLQIIFSPSFSVKDEVTNISGRGYGLDVVKDEIDCLKGKIEVKTQKDKGTKFSLRIPINKL